MVWLADRREDEDHLQVGGDLLEVAGGKVGAVIGTERRGDATDVPVGVGLAGDGASRASAVCSAKVAGVRRCHRAALDSAAGVCSVGAVGPRRRIVQWEACRMGTETPADR